MSTSHFGRRRHRANVRHQSAVDSFNTSLRHGRFSTANMPPSSQPYTNGVCHATAPDRKVPGSVPRPSPSARFRRMPDPIRLKRTEPGRLATLLAIIDAMIAAATRAGDNIAGQAFAKPEQLQRIWGMSA